ncbi:MAG: hypothetical protein ACMUIP_09355 [bacterium]
MLKPTTVRVSDKFLKDLSSFIKEMNLDKSEYLRQILQKGFEEDRMERIFDKYRKKELTMIQVCNKLDISPWDFNAHLKIRGIDLNTDLEDWLDSDSLS